MLDPSDEEHKIDSILAVGCFRGSLVPTPVARGGSFAALGDWHLQWPRLQAVMSVANQWRIDKDLSDPAVALRLSLCAEVRSRCGAAVAPGSDGCAGGRKNARPPTALCHVGGGLRYCLTAPQKLLYFEAL